MDPIPVQSYSDLAKSYDGERYVDTTHEMYERHRRRALGLLLVSGVHRALDIACGTGRGVVILREHARSVFGVDGTLEMLRVARTKTAELSPRPMLCQGNASQLPFADGAFDLVTCLNFVHLFPRVEDKAAFMRELARVLKPGGYGVVEFDNALQGGVLGAVRKYFQKDIGYDWPWTMRQCFPRDLVDVTATTGANLPFVWRIPGVRSLERLAPRAPLKWFTNRVFVQVRRK